MSNPLSETLLAELREWLPKVRAIKPAGVHGPFNATWNREARIMALYHGITVNEWLRHVRAVDDE